MDIAELLTFSVKNGASDLHLSAGMPPTCITGILTCSFTAAICVEK